jgi:chromosome partitioning protein
LFTIPADHGLKGIKSGQTQIEGGELRLRSCLRRQPLNDTNGQNISEFDWVIIDCPPSLDRLTMNALVAADFVLVPVDPGAGGRTALADTMDYITSAQKWYNPSLKILGMLINNVNTNTVYDQTTESAVRDIYGELVFTTIVPSSVRIRESAELRTPMVFCTGNEYKRYAEVYRDLGQEILARVGVRRG